MKKILLMGNPNVGKSVFFNRLTGANVIESNYPGTTVDYTKGYIRKFDEDFEIIDLTSDRIIAYEKKRFAFQFNFTEGHNYRIN